MNNIVRGPSNLHKKLKADHADESEAIQNYGQRARQMPNGSKTIKNIQKDERRHKRIIGRMIGK